jgi:hypothetical protein
MTFEMRRRAIRHFSSPRHTRAHNRALQRKWLASIASLGTNWVLHRDAPPRPLPSRRHRLELV